MIRIALPYPRQAHPTAAFGADYSSRRFVEQFYAHAESLGIQFQSHIAQSSDSLSSRRASDQAVGAALAPDNEAVSQRLAHWDLLHDVRPFGDPRRFFFLRSRIGGAFPITQTHHAINYPFYIQTYFVPLVLAHARQSDAIICQSTASREAVRRLLELVRDGLARLGCQTSEFAAQLPVIPNGVDTALFRPRDKLDVRYQLQLPGTAFVLLWVGRLSARTKADLLPLLRATAIMCDRNPDREVLLTLVGTDHEGYGRLIESSAEALQLRHRIRLHRVTPHDPVHLWY